MRIRLQLLPALAVLLAGCGGAADTNRPPAAANATASGFEDTILQGRLPKANDADGDAVTYELVATASHGTVVVQAGGAFSYTPMPDFHGTDEFTWRVVDARGAGNTYSMALTVAPVDDAPRLQGAPVMPGNITGNDVVIQPDGKLVVVGKSNRDIALLRYHADGSPDISFGGGDGFVIMPFGGTTDGYGLTLQPDGKLVVTGGAFNGVSYDIALLRYHVDGTLDAGFGGGDGIVITPVGDIARGYSVTLQPDGKLVVTGQVATRFGTGPSYYYGNDRIALLRYHSDGTLDASFGGGDGIVTALDNYTGGYSLALQLDGKLMVTGSVPNGDIALLRYNADGSPDTSFGGGDGIVTMRVDPYSQSERGRSLTLQPDGKLVLMWHACYEGMPAGDCSLGLSRHNADGSLDASFGEGGLVGGGGFDLNHGYLGISYRGNSVVLQSDGKLLVTRETHYYSDYSEIALLRYNANGTLDTGFGGGDGIVTTTLAPNNDNPGDGSRAAPVQAAVQPDGKLVVMGQAAIRHGTEPSYYYRRERLALLRYDTDGSFDRTFGRNVFDLREGATFAVPFPAGQIVDPDGDLLSYTARLASGAPLPAWLGFNPATLTFSGTVPGGSAGRNFTIRITATDPGGLSMSDIFSFAVVP